MHAPIFIGTQVVPWVRVHLCSGWWFGVARVSLTQVQTERPAQHRRVRTVFPPKIYFFLCPACMGPSNTTSHTKRRVTQNHRLVLLRLRAEEELIGYPREAHSNTQRHTHTPLLFLYWQQTVFLGTAAVNKRLLSPVTSSSHCQHPQHKRTFIQCVASEGALLHHSS